MIFPFTEADLPDGSTPPEKLCHPDAPDCEAARIERLHRETLVKAGWQPQLVDLLRSLGFTHCGPHSQFKGWHHWRKPHRDDFLHILLQPPGCIHDLPEAFYRAGQRDMRGQIAEGWNTLQRLLSNHTPTVFPGRPTIEQRLTALEARLNQEPSTTNEEPVPA